MLEVDETTLFYSDNRIHWYTLLIIEIQLHQLLGTLFIHRTSPPEFTPSLYTNVSQPLV